MGRFCHKKRQATAEKMTPVQPVELFPQPVEGIKIRPPRVGLRPGDVLLGYELVDAAPGCLSLDTMSTQGWLATGIVFVVAWPLAWIPPLLSTFHEPYQRPVYGRPGGAAPPTTGYPAPSTEYVEFQKPPKPAQMTGKDGSSPETAPLL